METNLVIALRVKNIYTRKWKAAWCSFTLDPYTNWRHTGKKQWQRHCQWTAFPSLFLPSQGCAFEDIHENRAMPQWGPWRRSPGRCSHPPSPRLLPLAPGPEDSPEANRPGTQQRSSRGSQCRVCMSACTDQGEEHNKIKFIKPL